MELAPPDTGVVGSLPREGTTELTVPTTCTTKFMLIALVGRVHYLLYSFSWNCRYAREL